MLTFRASNICPGIFQGRGNPDANTAVARMVDNVVSGSNDIGIIHPAEPCPPMRIFNNEAPGRAGVRRRAALATLELHISPSLAEGSSSRQNYAMPEDARLKAGCVLVQEEFVCSGVALDSTGSTATMMTDRLKELEKLQNWAHPLTSRHIPLKELAAHLHDIVVPCFLWGSEVWALSGARMAWLSRRRSAG